MTARYEYASSPDPEHDVTIEEVLLADGTLLYTEKHGLLTEELDDNVTAVVVSRVLEEHGFGGDEQPRSASGPTRQSEKPGPEL